MSNAEYMIVRDDSEHPSEVPACSQRSVRDHLFIALVLVASLAAPYLATAWASSEGLLLNTITAAQARERTRANPESRQRESRALCLANMVVQDKFLPTSRVAVRTLPHRSHSDAGPRVAAPFEEGRVSDLLLCGITAAMPAGPPSTPAATDPPLLTCVVGGHARISIQGRALPPARAPPGV